tara:strand:- start:526 stop:1335 length:810 start_codon:yes stop_codon:yes gene_type:complete
LPKEYLPGETPEQRKQRLRKLKGWSKTPQPIPTPVAKPTPKPTTRQVSNNTLQRSTPPKRIEEISKQTTHPSKKVAFVLGNGTSRASIDPESLLGKGTIYGCNALFRTFSPHYLIAVDTKMIKEISTAGYQLKNSVWTNPNKYTREISGLNLFSPNLGWSSGPTALNFASLNGAETIYILGFDYRGLGKKNELVNNLYSGTVNYKQQHDRATYFGNWQRQTSMVIKRNPRTRYIRVVEKAEYFVPENLIGLENLEHQTIFKFKQNLGIS